MIKQMRHILIALAALCAFCACSEVEIVEEEQTEKTVLMYFPYTGDSQNLHAFFLQNIADVEQAIAADGGLGRNRLLVYLAASGTAAELYEITYTAQTGCQHVAVRQFANPQQTTAEGIAAVLNAVKATAPARRYAMIIGSHGEGWLPAKQAAPRRTRYFGGTSPQYQTEITTLAAAIAASGMHMQFLLFDDCYLSCVETAYDLRQSADWLIASTSEMMDYGMPYHLLWFPLAAPEPDWDDVCRQFIAFYGAYSAPYGTIAATRLDQMDALAALMRRANAAHQWDPTRNQELQDLDAEHATPTIYFDFADYAERLCAGDDALLAELRQQMQALTPYKAHTDYIYSAAKNATVKVDHFCGLTVSDPSTNPKAVDAKTQTAWWRATH